MSQFVDLETAKSATGVRLVTAAGIPSPWSEAAKGVFLLANAPFVGVLQPPGDRSMREWTGARNVPAVLLEGEPTRTGWAEILELAERLAPKTARSLVPTAPHDRVRMFGLAHEVLGEGGLAWSARLFTIHEGLESDGKRGFPARVATYLTTRYGYTKEGVEPAKARVAEAWSLLAGALGDREYFFFDDRPSALDVYVAAVVNTFVVPPPEQCAMLPFIRAAFESMKDVIAQPPETIVALRDRMYARHLPLPIVV